MQANTSNNEEQEGHILHSKKISVFFECTTSPILGPVRFSPPALLAGCLHYKIKVTPQCIMNNSAEKGIVVLAYFSPHQYRRVQLPGMCSRHGFKNSKELKGKRRCFYEQSGVSEACSEPKLFRK